MANDLYPLIDPSLFTGELKNSWEKHLSGFLDYLEVSSDQLTDDDKADLHAGFRGKVKKSPSLLAAWKLLFPDSQLELVDATPAKGSKPSDPTTVVIDDNKSKDEKKLLLTPEELEIEAARLAAVAKKAKEDAAKKIELEKAKEAEAERKKKLDADLKERQRLAAIKAKEQANKGSDAYESLILDDARVDFAENSFAKIKLKAVKQLNSEQIGDMSGLKAKLRLVVRVAPDYSNNYKATALSQIDMSFFDWDDPIVEEILAMAQYVVMNGPVGVGKPSKWPELTGVVSIASKFKAINYPDEITNRLWRSFVENFVSCLDLTHPSYQTCKMVEQWGSVWPLCAGVFVPKSAIRERAEDKAFKEKGSEILSSK